MLPFVASLQAGPNTQTQPIEILSACANSFKTNHADAKLGSVSVATQVECPETARVISC